MIIAHGSCKKNTAVADDQDDWRLIKNTPQDRLEVNAHSTPQWNYTPEGVLAIDSSPQVGLGGAELGLRSSELYLKCICSKKKWTRLLVRLTTAAVVAVGNATC